MPTIYIDDKKIEAKNGETIIAAAFRNGLEIPHFCWHPELSVAGNCRMCLVEIGTPKRNPDGSFAKDDENNLIIGYMPKLQIACNTIVSDEMHVLTKSSKAVKAQEAVMEFLLINHPLDCPICDEAGQCKLQEYSFNHSAGESRFEENKNPNPKRIDWNDKVMYDAERCISCSRCIRFTKEIANEDILTFINRGDKVRIERFDDAKIQNEYSMNIIDSCPVGALTSKDFRFKARVWEMSFNDSICPGCAKGCNIKIGVRNNEILRLEPRENQYVNKFYMCDFGRINQYKFVNENRILYPQINQNNCTLSEAVDAAAKSIKSFKPNEIQFLASPLSSNENNYMLLLLASSMKAKINFIYRNDTNFGDKFLKQNDRSPNRNGVESLGITAINQSQLISQINSEDIKCLYILDENFEFTQDLMSALPKLKFVILHTFNKSAAAKHADVLFPAATYAEYEGTFTNTDKRVQHFVPALTTTKVRSMLPHNSYMSRLDVFGSHNDKWNQHESRENVWASWQIIRELLKKINNSCEFKTAEQIFLDIAKKNSNYAGMSYDLLDKYQGVTLGKASNPDEIIAPYHANKMRP